MDDKRYAAGHKLLDAAHKFWKACHSEGQFGAVQWLEGTDGELLVFTRSEYRQQIMQNIARLPNVEPEHVFVERLQPFDGTDERNDDGEESEEKDSPSNIRNMQVS